MSTTPTEAPIPSYTSEQAIELLASKADMIEQVAIDLKKASEQRLFDSGRMELRGYTVTEDKRQNGYYELKKNGAYISIQSGGCSVRDKTGLYHAGCKRAEQELNSLIEDLGDVGVLTHKVHLDTKVLDSRESHILTHLPSKLEEARAAFQYVIDRAGSVDGREKDEMIQYKRNVKFLESLLKEIGNAGEVMVEHNNKLIDRQSELRTEQEINDDKASRFKKGVEYLDSSAKHAAQYNPAYRERIRSRKEHPELKVLEDAPQISK